MREAYFYHEFAKILSDSGFRVPEITLALVDPASARRCIVMEDLSDCIQAGHFFGPKQPVNWGKDLVQICSKADSDVDAIMITRKAFLLAANLHGRFWMDQPLLNNAKEWLRAADWLQGTGQESWEAAENIARDAW